MNYAARLQMRISMVNHNIAPEHVEELRVAKDALENAGVAIQFTNFIGSRIENAVEMLPKDWEKKIVGISSSALEKAADIAIWTIDPAKPLSTNDLLHKLAVSASGAAGGAFGLPALAIELPISTTIMLRSIVDIARCEGEDIFMPEAKLACVEVFALGGRTTSDDAAESGYYAVRAGLGAVVGEAAAYLAKEGAKVAAPAMVRFITQVAARFQIQVTEKAAAQAFPIVGAAGGALINNIFMSHFQNMARAHFTIRRLERTYTPELIEADYYEL